ncbi:MAG: OsmC family protein [Bacteroidia bacterium]|nr:OsmC family protein [Bacteroidia bacterium]
MKRHASAVWNGTLKEGKGTISTPTTVLNNTQYSFTSRFEEGIGTNPEELVAAAHAGCFSMALAARITNTGITPESVQTKATLDMKNDGGWSVVGIHLETTVKASGLTNEKLQELAENARANCIISKLFTVPITLDAKLV